MKKLLKLAKAYNTRVIMEETKSKKEIMIETVGMIDPKRHLLEEISELMTSNVDQSLGSSLGAAVFKL